MNIHEYQAQKLFGEFGIPVPSGIFIESGMDVDSTVRGLDFDKICVKAQIHAGGRCNGRFKNDIGCGGVEIVNSKDEAIVVAKAMLGNSLVTAQTGSNGRVVNKVLLSQVIEIVGAYYTAIVLDRNIRRQTLIISADGGIDIEAVAEKFPEKLHRITIDPAFGLRPYQVSEVAYRIGLEQEQAVEFSAALMNLYKLSTEKDCTLAEINPFALTADGHFVAVDSKINFDDSALVRHPEIAKLRDIGEEDPRETAATNFGLNYVALDGDIACLVNGAGLAMATMDIIKHYGRNPSNFLDVGGGASETQISRAFEVILKDTNVKGILVNIFGGIVKCDVVANGVISAARAINLTLPIVARLEGTNVEIGRQLLAESGLRVFPATDLGDAARQIVALANSGKNGKRGGKT
jgi:succinyl-CoA synthetase beta subunit